MALHGSGCKLLYYVAQYAVIGGNKVSPWGSKNNSPPPGANPGINHYQVDCFLREELIGRAQDKGGLRDILRSNGMADINQPRIRIDTEYYSFHSRHIGIGKAEVGGQGNYGTHPHSPEQFFIKQGAALLFINSQLLANLEGYYSDSNKQNYQDDCKLEQSPFQPAFSPVDGISLTEDASQTTALHLQQNDEYQGYGQYNLRNTEGSKHVILPLTFSLAIHLPAVDWHDLWLLSLPARRGT